MFLLTNIGDITLNQYKDFVAHVKQRSVDYDPVNSIWTNSDLNTLSALGRVYEFITKSVGVTKVTKKLLTSTTGASMRYETYLKENRYSARACEKGRKRKATMSGYTDLDAKIQRTEAEVPLLFEEADSKALSAEKKGDRGVLRQSNAIRKGVVKK